MLISFPSRPNPLGFSPSTQTNRPVLLELSMPPAPPPAVGDFAPSFQMAILWLGWHFVSPRGIPTNSGCHPTDIQTIDLLGSLALGPGHFPYAATIWRFQPSESEKRGWCSSLKAGTLPVVPPGPSSITDPESL